MSAFANAYYAVDFDAGAGFARLRRSAEAFPTLKEMDQAHLEVEAELRKLGARRLLIDLRGASAGRHDSAFENGGRALRQRLARGYGTVGFLVRTEAGRLQVQRLSRADGIEARVFLDEEEALRWMAEMVG